MTQALGGNNLLAEECHSETALRNSDGVMDEGGERASEREKEREGTHDEKEKKKKQERWMDDEDDDDNVCPERICFKKSFQRYRYKIYK